MSNQVTRNSKSNYGFNRMNVYGLDASQAIPDVTDTVVLYDNVDPQNTIPSSILTYDLAGTFTVVREGLFSIDHKVAYQGNDNGYREVFIELNGNGIHRGTNQCSAANQPGEILSITSSGMYYLREGDTFQCETKTKTALNILSSADDASRNSVLTICYLG